MAGQTQSEIRQLLDAAGLTPQHRFGQNFLVDLNLMRKLVGSADVSASDTVLEVGCGTGSLTEMLLETGAQVVGVEIDHGFQALLRERLARRPNFALVRADILASKHRINPLVLKILGEHPPRKRGCYQMVANLPYQVATPLLVDLLHVTPPLARLTGTIQKEVGERLGAEPDTEAYGPVSVLMQSFAQVRPLAIIPPSAFWPRPKVESLMVQITPLPPEETGIDDPEAFKQLVQSGFQQRRKKLRRLMRGGNEMKLLTAFGKAGVNPDSRPGELSPVAWRRLYAGLREVSP